MFIAEAVLLALSLSFFVSVNMTPMFKRNVIKTLLIKGVKMQLMIARIWSIIWSTKHKNGTTDICNAVFCGERGILR